MQENAARIAVVGNVRSDLHLEAHLCAPSFLAFLGAKGDHRHQVSGSLF
jgi:hypothetical protein